MIPEDYHFISEITEELSARVDNTIKEMVEIVVNANNPHKKEILVNAEEIWRAIEKMPEYEKLKDRDTAKKPEIFAGYGWRGVIKLCPKCMQPVGSKVSRFCQNCGQRIEWSDLPNERLPC